MNPYIPRLDIRQLYNRFDAPVTDVDCGRMCAPHNPGGKPFCCDICHSVPAAFHQEWEYLQVNTDLWHPWRGDECAAEPVDPASLQDETPEHMRLLACLGPESCRRPFRAISCRQFPFFPYIDSNYTFIGMSYNWDFEATCWVISHLERVTDEYRRQFVQTYDELFALWDEEFESYIALSEEMRAQFAERRRRIPLIQRDGGTFLISPKSERLHRVDAAALPKFGVYR
jgi:hypothetical protein